MPKFRKKPVVIEATQWYRNGDHPLDYAKPIDGFENDVLVTFTGEYAKMHDWEGQIVRRYRRPDDSGPRRCEKCHHTMHDHGWIDSTKGGHDHGWQETLDSGHNVCPGDWIITGVKGEYYPCKPDIFEMTYEPA